MWIEGAALAPHQLNFFPGGYPDRGRYGQQHLHGIVDGRGVVLVSRQGLPVCRTQRGPYVWRSHLSCLA